MLNQLFCFWSAVLSKVWRWALGLNIPNEFTLICLPKLANKCTDIFQIFSKLICFVSKPPTVAKHAGVHFLDKMPNNVLVRREGISQTYYPLKRCKTRIPGCICLQFGKKWKQWNRWNRYWLNWQVYIKIIRHQQCSFILSQIVKIVSLSTNI